MTWTLTDEQMADLRARFAVIQSRGASILSQASLVEKLLDGVIQDPAGRFPGDPGPGNLLHGLKVDDTGAAGANDVSGFEAAHSLSVALHRSYFRADEQAALCLRISDDLAHHRVPWVSTKLPGTWAQMASGSLDSWLTPLVEAAETAADGKLALLTLHHEPEDDQATMGTAADYRAMFDHAIPLLSAGHSVQILPCLIGYGHWRWTGQRWGTPQSWVADSCEHIGSDAYNPWYAGQPAGTWHSATDCLDNVAQLNTARPDCVQWIGEWATHTDTSQPGKAAQWMSDFYGQCLALGVAGISYYSSALNAPNGPWTLDGETTPEWVSLAALATSVHTV